MHWAVAMLVDFVINFVIGAAIFWWMESVPMWDLPRPCFGMDIVITCAAQAFIKWMVDGTFTRRLPSSLSVLLSVIIMTHSSYF
tara:strand:+ start:2387 stop:2638 length:252 start_codon:yes stop_codon:yes gene_type:complete